MPEITGVEIKDSTFCDLDLKSDLIVLQTIFNGMIIECYIMY